MEVDVSEREAAVWHGTTILSVRKGDIVVVAGDGQVSFGQTVIKANARKVRRLGDGTVIAGSVECADYTSADAGGCVAAGKFANISATGLMVV